MNWVDLVIVLVLALYAFHGWRRGFLLIALDLGEFVLSVGLALLLFRYAGPMFGRFGLSPSMSNAAAFVAIYIVAQIGLWLVGCALYRLVPKSARNSTANRLLGAVPSVVKGFVLCSLMVMALAVLPLGVPRQAVLDSRIGSRMLGFASAVERHAASVFSGAIQEALTFLTIKPDSTETIRNTPQTKDVQVDFDAEEEMLRLVNRERHSRGLKPLKLDSQLRALARKHSRDMFERGYFAHKNPDGLDPFDRMRRAGFNYREAGENLAMAPTVEIAHDGLMNSPGHRENILDPKFGRVGIGVYTSDIFGKMFSQEFAD